MDGLKIIQKPHKFWVAPGAWVVSLVAHKDCQEKYYVGIECKQPDGISRRIINEYVDYDSMVDGVYAVAKYVKNNTNNNYAGHLKLVSEDEPEIPDPAA